MPRACVSVYLLKNLYQKKPYNFIISCVIMYFLCECEYVEKLVLKKKPYPVFGKKGKKKTRRQKKGKEKKQNNFKKHVFKKKAIPRIWNRTSRDCTGVPTAARDLQFR